MKHQFFSYLLDLKCKNHYQCKLEKSLSGEAKIPTFSTIILTSLGDRLCPVIFFLIFKNDSIFK